MASFHINQTYTFWETAISKSNLNKSKVKVMGEVKYQGYIGYPTSNRNTSLSIHVNGTNHQIWPIEDLILIKKMHLKFGREKKVILYITNPVPYLSTISKANPQPDVFSVILLQAIIHGMRQWDTFSSKAVF